MCVIVYELHNQGVQIEGAYLLASLMIAMEIRIFLIRARRMMSRMRNMSVPRIPVMKGRRARKYCTSLSPLSSPFSLSVPSLPPSTSLSPLPPLSPHSLSSLFLSLSLYSLSAINSLSHQQQAMSTPDTETMVVGYQSAP